MRIKCAGCEKFVPVEDKAHRYCANCGRSLMDHPHIADLRGQVTATTAANGQLAKYARLLSWAVLGFIFLVVPRFPPESQLFGFAAALLSQFMGGRYLKQTVTRRHPEIFASEWWQP